MNDTRRPLRVRVRLLVSGAKRGVATLRACSLLTHAETRLILTLEKTSKVSTTETPSMIVEGEVSWMYRVMEQP